MVPWTLRRALDILSSGSGATVPPRYTHSYLVCGPGGYNPKGRLSDLLRSERLVSLVFDVQKDDTRRLSCDPLFCRGFILKPEKRRAPAESCEYLSVPGITSQRSNARVRGLLCPAGAILSPCARSFTGGAASRMRPVGVAYSLLAGPASTFRSGHDANLYRPKAAPCVNLSRADVARLARSPRRSFP
jgi:hypothetical protein